MRLFCFPYAGGRASAYLPWQRWLPVGVELVPVELPGHGTRMREPSVETMAALVDAVLPVLARALDRPFALYGHSMGALLAYEAAQALRARTGLEPRALLVSGADSPTRRDASHFEAIESDRELMDFLRRMAFTPGEVLADPDLMSLMLPILRADVRVCASYRARALPPLACPVHVFAGRDDRTREAGLRDWAQHARGGCSLDVLPGGHFFIHQHRAEFLGALARRLGGTRADEAVSPASG